jgi:starch synthase
MDKEHHRASLKSQRENTAATFDSIVLCAGRDWGDNDIRFARFALVSTKIAAGLVDPSWAADLVHVNDWPASLVPGYVHWMGYCCETVLNASSSLAY